MPDVLTARCILQVKPSKSVDMIRGHSTLGKPRHNIRYIGGE
jgi:hypothetical protein